MQPHPRAERYRERAAELRLDARGVSPYAATKLVYLADLYERLARQVENTAAWSDAADWPPKQHDENLGRAEGLAVHGRHGL
jgi:hypothetical protein